MKSGLAGADNSQRAYELDMKRYLGWCDDHEIVFCPLPLSSLLLYVTGLSKGRKFATVQRHVASISRLHRLAGVESPTASSLFATYMKGVRRSYKDKENLRQKQAPDFTIEELKQAVDQLPDTTTGRRDKVILLLGFTGAFRRDELINLDVSHLSINQRGVLIRMLHSKTNQMGEVEEKAIRRVKGPYCAVTALEALLPDLPPAATTGPNPLFRCIQRGKLVTAKRLSAAWVNRVVGNVMGMNSEGINYTAHSLRASFVTISKHNNVDDRIIMNQTKHRNTTMIDRYDRRRNMLEHNATDQLGLGSPDNE